MKKLLPWQLVDGRWERQEEGGMVVGYVLRDKMCYSAIYMKMKLGIEVRDYFISKGASINYIDAGLYEQGYRDKSAETNEGDNK